ncbi:MAG TPA: PLP-dependent aminotransferase family protein [Stellaceae bacterium]|jgi:GntR family transcriptional regulator/MocR family aminotransferase|nr:PLP-dependent aminotransferase family protein [Stellaceae bacterium]
MPSVRASLRPAGAALWTTRLDRTSTLPLSRQLATALRQAISDGSLGVGARLPSSRALAGELGLARSTVVGVFEQLTAEGYIAAKAGSSHYIPARADAGAAPANDKERPTTPRLLSRQAKLLSRLAPPPRATPRPFEMGYAEIDGRFIATWKRLASRTLSGRSRIDWNYGDPQGEPRLRAAIAEYLAAARGVRCRPEQIVLTAGTQQGLSITARILIDPGTSAWVEDPCYRIALDILRAAEARIVPMPVDGHGLDIAAAPADAAPPRLVYTTPSRQYPLGVAMPLARRLALLAWAERAGAWIIEDDYESEFQRPGRTLPSLQGLDRAGRVIYLGTFSKLLFPSLRLGYAVLPEDLVEPFIAVRHLTDRQSSGLIQAIMTEFILGGHFARHLKRMRTHYAARQEFLCDLLSRRLPGLLDIKPVESGMYLTAGLPSGWDDRAIAAKLAAVGVTALPLSALTLATKRPPGLVLGYAGHTDAAMERAAQRMTYALETETGLTLLTEAELYSDR